MALRLWLIISALAMFIINRISASTTLLNGTTTGAVSALFPTRITPAGFTFSIWSLIYLGIIGLIIAILTKKTALTNESMMLFILSCIRNFSRIIAWQYEYLTLAMILILALLISLILRDRDMWIHRAGTPYYPQVRSVLHLYIGRISIATLVMATVYAQYGLGILGGIEYNVALATLGLGIVVHLVILCTTGYITAALAAIWALWGISQAQGNTTIDTTCFVGMSLLGIGVIIIGIQRYLRQCKINKLNQIAQDKKKTL